MMLKYMLGIFIYAFCLSTHAKETPPATEPCIQSDAQTPVGELAQTRLIFPPVQSLFISSNFLKKDLIESIEAILKKNLNRNLSANLEPRTKINYPYSHIHINTAPCSQSYERQQCLAEFAITGHNNHSEHQTRFEAIAIRPVHIELDERFAHGKIALWLRPMDTDPMYGDALQILKRNMRAIDTRQEIRDSWDH